MIGMFDSGVGGLSILSEILKTFTSEDILYIADQKNIPYSTKSTDFLKQRAKELSGYLIDRGASTIIVACNTATVAAIDYLRNTFPTTVFVGVEPAIKPAVTFAGKETVLVLATKSTLASSRMQTLIAEHKGEGDIKLHDMPTWVVLAEDGDINSEQSQKMIIDSLEPLKDPTIKAVVLACTHYPFFKPYIEQAFPQAEIFEPSKAVTARTKQVHTSKIRESGIVTLLTTGQEQSFAKSVSHLLGNNPKVQSINRLILN